MSVHLTSRVWKWPAPDSSTKLVLLKLADNANDEGVCWPSLKRIEHETGLSRSTVCNRLAKLEQMSLILRTPGGIRPGKRGGENTRYRILAENLSAARTSPPHALPGSAPHGQEVVRHTDPNHQWNRQNKPPTSAASPPRGANWPLSFAMLCKIQDSKLDSLTKPERGQLTDALAAISKAMPDRTDDQLAKEIRRRASNYREIMPTALLTASALARHWSRCESEAPHKPKIEEPTWDWRAAYMAKWGTPAPKDELWQHLPASYRFELKKWHEGEAPLQCQPRPVLNPPPDGYERALDALFGKDWRSFLPAWPHLEPTDRTKVKAWLAENPAS